MLYERKDGECAARVLAFIHNNGVQPMLWIEAVWDKRRAGGIRELRNRTCVSVPYFIERYGVHFKDILVDHARRREVTTEARPPHFMEAA